MDKGEIEEEKSFTVEQLKSIRENRYNEYLKADDAYRKSLMKDFDYLKDKYIHYNVLGREGYVHCRTLFRDVGKDKDSLYIQGLGFSSSFSDYQDDCEFHWSWWTEISIPERIYCDKNELRNHLEIITEDEFKKKFKEAIDEVKRINDEIIKDESDSCND